MLSIRSLKTGQHFSLRNEEMGIGSWFDPRDLLHGGRKIRLQPTEEFRERFKRSKALQNWRISILHLYTAFDMTQGSLRSGPYEWEKIRLIPPGYRFLHLWEVLLVYRAHRLGYESRLLSQEDATNTFYVQDGLLGLAVDIERDADAEEPESWWVHARSLGDDHDMPRTQRIFVGR